MLSSYTFMWCLRIIYVVFVYIYVLSSYNMCCLRIHLCVVFVYICIFYIFHLNVFELLNVFVLLFTIILTIFHYWYIHCCLLLKTMYFIGIQLTYTQHTHTDMCVCACVCHYISDDEIIHFHTIRICRFVWICRFIWVCNSYELSISMWWTSIYFMKRRLSRRKR